MHSHRNIVHLCGIFLMAFRLASSKNYIPENMEAPITKLKEFFNVSGDISLFGDSTFLKHLINKEDRRSEQKLMMFEVLDVYVHILSYMKNHTEGEVRKSIDDVLRHFNVLRNIYQKQQRLKTILQELWATKVNKNLHYFVTILTLTQRNFYYPF
ncbi:IFN-gamma precursor-related protein [Arapaima gigas]